LQKTAGENAVMKKNALGNTRRKEADKGHDGPVKKIGQ
jgi:hypothetical protein